MKIPTAALWIVVLASSTGSAQTNTFPSSGNVGIGTTSPTATLVVTGNGAAGTPAVIINSTSASSSGEAEDNRPFVIRRSATNTEELATYVQDNVVSFNYKNDETVSYMHFRFRNTDTETGSGANASDRVVLALGSNTSRGTAVFDGYVGIGTSSPDHPLDVNGSVRAKEVIVETGWSDFVFSKDYRLRSLVEVEEHIQTHGHLPDVPSATIVAKEGLSVGDAQKVMMQKIEELTLYLIAQEKRINALEAELRNEPTRIQRSIGWNHRASNLKRRKAIDAEA